MNATMNQLSQLTEQYNALAESLQGLTPERANEGAGTMLNMIMCRIAVIDLKVDLLATRLMPSEPEPSRIVVPR